MFPLQVISHNQADTLAYIPLEFVEQTSEDAPEISNVLYVVYSRQDLASLISVLKLHSLTRATNAIDATVVDRLDHELRFNTIYMLQSYTTNSRYNLITWASETNPIVSLQSMFPAFNWAEREIWDLFGLFVIKHPDLRRILTDYGFVGHPLRKDFPLTGFKEVQYEDIIKQVEYSNTELSQSYRLLSHTNPWAHD
jgi:NADH-quinone oxidoreductase subunit C